MYDQIVGTVKERNGNTAVIMTEYFGIKFMFPAHINIEEDAKQIIYLYYCLKDVNGTINQDWYGFTSSIERDFFKKVISIKGIGEKTAITILSMFTPLQLIQIIRNKDAKLLSKVPKIGQKSAEKFILDMDKLNDILLINELKNASDNQQTNAVYSEEEFSIDLSDVENADKHEKVKQTVSEALYNLGFLADTKFTRQNWTLSIL